MTQEGQEAGEGLTEEEKEEIELLTPLDLKTSAKMEKMVHRMISENRPPEEIYRAIHSDMMNLWNTPENWVEVTVILPKAIFEEQQAIIKRSKKIINALDRMTLPPSISEELGPSIPDSAPDALVYGHVIVRGGNDLMKTYAAKVAERKAHKMMRDLMQGRPTGKDSLIELMSRLAGQISDSSEDESENKDESNEKAKDQAGDLPGYQ
jgi:hypothetical protein